MEISKHFRKASQDAIAQRSKSNTLVHAGHPFAPIGRGEDIRTCFRACQAVGLNSGLLDVHRYKVCVDKDIELEFSSRLVENLSCKVNLFHINGNEVEQTLSKIQLPEGAHNIIYPQWELDVYPDEWASELSRFDEIWAPSRFVYDALRKCVKKPVYYLPLASEVQITEFLSRRYFGIPESSYAFLFFFDFTSFIDRKNPFAVFRAFEKLCGELPSEDICLVIKTNSAAQKEEDFRRFEDEMKKFSFKDRAVVINKTLSNNEVRNLVNLCDSFISLHRAEGYGRGMAEAMYLGKPVIATRYSGNLDFMDENNSCLVDYRLIPVEKGQYPFATGQVWADPDVEHAVFFMRKLLCDRQYGRKIGEAASRHVRKFFSYRAVGLKCLQRIEEIIKTNSQVRSKTELKNTN